jgi:hypothetical protein
MIETIPVPLQALLWPLCGTALILAVRRLLPNWLRRVVALAAALASLAALWSLRGGPAEPVTISWVPLTLFRTGPMLMPAGLSLFVGITMTAITAALILGLRGDEPQTTKWHGLVLLALPGALLAVLAGNLLTLALGSGMLDVALVALAVATGKEGGRIAWRMAVPGIVSTLLLLFGAVRMDAQIGTTSLLARNVPAQVLLLVGLAGLLRLLLFPLHTRGLNTAESAATLLLPMGTGIYILARAQAIGPVLADRPWVPLLAGVGLIAGGVLAWVSGVNPGSGPAGIGTKNGWAENWTGIAIHQAALAVAYALLLKTQVPWPWVGLGLALGILAVWWESSKQAGDTLRPAWLGSLAAGLQSGWKQAKSFISTRLGSDPEATPLRQMAYVRWWYQSWLGRHAAAILPIVALMSLGGVPFTAGWRVRWPFYAALLKKGQSSLLIAAILADSLLAAGLWTAMGRALRSAGDHRPRLSALLSMIVLDGLLFWFGVAPAKLAGGFGLGLSQVPDVSVWGLGLVYGLPWLIGAWLSRVGMRLGRGLDYMQSLVRLEWLYRIATQLAQRLAAVVYWLSMVGEGEGWWGWALIILALGTLFLTMH